MYGGAPPPQSPQYATRALVESFDRPYANGNGAADFMALEYPLVLLGRGTRPRRHILDRHHICPVPVPAREPQGPAHPGPRRIMDAQGTRGSSGGAGRVG